MQFKQYHIKKQQYCYILQKEVFVTMDYQLSQSLLACCVSHLFRFYLLYPLQIPQCCSVVHLYHLVAVLSSCYKNYNSIGFNLFSKDMLALEFTYSCVERDFACSRQLNPHISSSGVEITEFIWILFKFRVFSHADIKHTIVANKFSTFIFPTIV